MPVTQQHIEKATEIARAYGARRLVLFGRGQTDPEAARDLDIPLDVIPFDRSAPFTRRVEERGEVLHDE